MFERDDPSAPSFDIVIRRRLFITDRRVANKIAVVIIIYTCLLKIFFHIVGVAPVWYRPPVEIIDTSISVSSIFFPEGERGGGSRGGKFKVVAVRYDRCGDMYDASSSRRRS